MGEVVKFKKQKLSEKHKGKGLCKSGFHKWEIYQNKKFDVKEGRLVTVFKCARCSVTKSELR